MPKVLLILLIIVVGALPSFYLYWSARKTQRKHQWISYLLRWTGCSLLLALLFWPSFKRTTYKEVLPELVFIEDASNSVEKSLTATQIANKNEFITALQSKVNLTHLYFAENIHADSSQVNKTVSGITSALQHAINIAEQTKAKGIVLLSDGINNIGQSYLDLAAQTSVPIYTIGVGDSTKPKDLAIKQLYYNDIVTVGHEFEILATAYFQKVPPGNYVITLSQNGQQLQQKTIALHGGMSYQDVSFILKASQTGIFTYTISIKPAENELNIANNTATATIEALEQKIKTIVLYTEPHPDINAIVRTLSSNQKFEITTKSITENIDLSTYDLIVAHQLPLSSLPKEKAKWIIGNEEKAYVPNAQSPQFNDNHPLHSILSQGIAAIEQWPPLQSGAKTQMGNPIIMQHDQPIWYIQDTEQQLVTNGIGLWKWRMHNFKVWQNFDAFNQLVFQSLDLLTLKQQKNPLVLKGLKGAYYANEAIQVSAYTINKLGQQDNTYELKAKLYHEDQEIMEVNPILYSNYYKIPISKLGNGNYKLKVSANIDGKLHTVEQLFEVLAIDLESLQTNAIWSDLIQLSLATNGRFTPIDSITSLNMLEGNLLNISIKEDVSLVSLIDYKWILGLVLALFISEWLIRKYFYA